MKKLMLSLAVFTGILSFGFNNSFESQQVTKEKIDIIQYAHGETI